MYAQRPVAFLSSCDRQHERHRRVPDVGYRSVEIGTLPPRETPAPVSFYCSVTDAACPSREWLPAVAANGIECFDDLKWRILTPPVVFMHCRHDNGVAEMKIKSRQ